MLERGTIPAIWAVGDTGALSIIAVSLLGWIPAIAACLAILWYVIQVLESKTVQNLLRTRRLRRLVKLRAEATALELLIRDKNTDLRGLDYANVIHEAAIGAATSTTHTMRLEDDAVEKLAAAAVEKADLKTKSTPQS